MPCQCATTTTGASDAEITYGGCDCGTETAGDCECGTAATHPGRERSLERIVMELDKRVRRLEAGR